MRRLLEECDAAQGFHLLCDADSGFGGIASALLTQIRDDYTRAPCLAFGLGTLTRHRHRPSSSADERTTAVTAAVADMAVDDGGLGAHTYAPALNDALSLTAFAELNTCYVPVYGSAGLRALLDANAPTAAIGTSQSGPPSSPAGSGSAGVAAAAGGGAHGRGCSGTAGGGMYAGCPAVTAPPLLAPRTELRYHTSAPLAALLEAATLPYRAHASAGSLNALVRALAPRGGMHLACGVLAVPMPSQPELAACHHGWLMPMLPLQRRPAACRAFEQNVCWMGHAGGGRAVAPMLPSLLPCRSEGGSLWVRPQPFALPLSYPQFFSSAVGVHGDVHGAPNDAVSRHFLPPLPRAPRSSLRAAEDEVLRVPIAGALQCSPALMPVLRRVCSDWAAERRSAERAGVAEGWAQRDELSEVTEALASMRDAYGDDEGDMSASATSGWSSG